MRIVVTRHAQYVPRYSEGFGVGVAFDIGPTELPAGPDAFESTCRMMRGPSLVLEVPNISGLARAVAYYAIHREFAPPGERPWPTSVASAVARFRAAYTAQFGVACPL